jgi:plastocyanin
MRESIKVLLITAGLLIILAALASCGGGGDGTATPAVQAVTCPASGTTDVSIEAAAFSPTSVAISANGIVKWTNNDVSTHTVTGATGLFDAQVNPGGSVCFQFTRAGTYSYSDTTNPSMAGSVTVTGVGGYGY